MSIGTGLLMLDFTIECKKRVPQRKIFSVELCEAP
jgi:hypothetical protein